MIKRISLLILCSVSFAALAQDSKAKFGYTNLEFVVTQMNEYSEVQDKVQELQGKWNERISDHQSKIQEAIRNYESARSVMDQENLQKLEAEIIKLQNQYKEIQAKAAQDIQTENERLLNELYKKAEAAVQTVAKNESLSAVFNSGSIIYTDKDQYQDITPLIYKELNISEKAE